MKILVPIKRVADPDNASKLKVSGDGTAVTSEGLEWKMNPFDDWSLEAALRLTELDRNTVDPGLEGPETGELHEQTLEAMIVPGQGLRIH